MLWTDGSSAGNNPRRMFQGSGVTRQHGPNQGSPHIKVEPLKGGLLFRFRQEGPRSGYKSHFKKKDDFPREDFLLEGPWEERSLFTYSVHIEQTPRLVHG